MSQNHEEPDHWHPVTLLVAYNMHAGQDWSAGQNKVPRQYIGEYLHMAYDEGRGADAAREYFASDGIDHAADAADRHNGAPIHHTIKAMICDGLNVAVYHHIAANGTDPEMDVVDIYRTKRGHIIGASAFGKPPSARLPPARTAKARFLTVPNPAPRSPSRGNGCIHPRSDPRNRTPSALLRSRHA